MQVEILSLTVSHTRQQAQHLELWADRDAGKHEHGSLLTDTGKSD